MECYLKAMSLPNSTEVARPSYHHGDLRQALLKGALDLIADVGIDNLSLRRLAERVGVSRTAPYHHFSDKNDLLCAIAAVDFKSRHEAAKELFADTSKTQREKFEQHIYRYIRFAVDNPDRYELMFGRSIWRQSNSTQEVRDAAYPFFQETVDMIRSWQDCGLIAGTDALRTSQVIWGAQHGIAKLWIDGIYTDPEKIEELSLCAVEVFASAAD